MFDADSLSGVLALCPGPYPSHSAPIGAECSDVVCGLVSHISRWRLGSGSSVIVKRYRRACCVNLPLLQRLHSQLRLNSIPTSEFRYWLAGRDGPVAVQADLCPLPTRLTPSEALQRGVPLLATLHVRGKPGTMLHYLAAQNRGLGLLTYAGPVSSTMYWLATSPWAKKTAPWLSGELEAMEDPAIGGRLAKLPTTTLHGDFRAENLVTSTDRLSHLIDFDMVTVGPRFYDLLGRPTQIELLRQSDPGAFLSGVLQNYLSIAGADSPLEASEVKCASLVLRLAILYSVCAVSVLMTLMGNPCQYSGLPLVELAATRMTTAHQLIRLANQLGPDLGIRP